ncbi:MAG: phage portal protein family protein [Terriglobia bacterium]
MKRSINNSGNGYRQGSLLKEMRALRREIQNPKSEIQNRIGPAVALADAELGLGGTPGASSSPSVRLDRGYGGLPVTDRVWAPVRPAEAPVPGSLATPAFGHPSSGEEGSITASRGDFSATFGVSGTPITSGFLLDLGEYNPELMGRNAIPTYEKMRRSDAQVRATLAACKLPILSAKWEVMSTLSRSAGDGKVSSSGSGTHTEAKAKEIAEFVKGNLFGGLEFKSSTGGWVSQGWQSVIANALLMLDFGCAIHEDVWAVEGNTIRLRSLPSRLPLTFYRWHTEADGETLMALEQYGYRGDQFLNVLLPADKIARFTYQQEGANFWGIALQRAMYPHWYIKSKLYRLDAIANERNSLGVPVFRLAAGFSSQDKEAAYNYVTQLASHEATGLVEPPGDQTTGFRIVGYEGRLREVLPSIQHHNEMISRAALNTFMDLGQSAHGSRALGATATDFFMLGLQSVADQIATDITNSTIRRLVALNFGDEAPVPRLVAGNVQARSVAEMTGDLVSLAQQGLIVSENNLRKHIREKLALPEESAEGIVATRGETIDVGTLGATISGRSGGAVEQAAKSPAGSVGAGAATRKAAQAEGQPAQPSQSGTAGGVNVQASEIDQAGHSHRENVTAAQVLHALKSAKPWLAKDAARQAARLPIEQLQYVALPFPHQLAQRVRAILERAAEYGEQQIFRERREQTGRPATDRERLADSANEKAKKEIEAALEAEAAKRGGKKQGPQGDMSQKPPAAAERNETAETIANATVSDALNWISSRAAGAAIEGAKEGLAQEQIKKKVENTLLAASDGPLSRTAQEASRQAVFVGRLQAIKSLGDEVVAYHRAEAMDDHTCPPCRVGNGTKWKRLEDVDWAPGDDCEGGDACRGRLWAQFREGMYTIENGVKKWVNEK